MSRLGKMYTTENRYDNDDEWIVVEELRNTVALMHTQSNRVVWLTFHALDLNKEFKLKKPMEQP